MEKRLRAPGNVALSDSAIKPKHNLRQLYCKHIGIATTGDDLKTANEATVGTAEITGQSIIVAHVNRVDQRVRRVKWWRARFGLPCTHPIASTVVGNSAEAVEE